MRALPPAPPLARATPLLKGATPLAPLAERSTAQALGLAGLLVAGLLVVGLLGPACSGPAAAPLRPAEESAVRDGLNDRFLADDLDVDQFVRTFEVESREIAGRRDRIVAALGIMPGDRVADVGAGTGLFLSPLSRAVGGEGMVYAVDISPRFVEHLRERVAQERISNSEVVMCTEKDCLLPESSVDRIFVCDTYHHFTYPRTTLTSLHRALRPGGEMVVVDFERVPGVSRDWVLGHVRAGKEVFTAEILEAGFTLAEEVDVGLEENYMLRFRR